MTKVRHWLNNPCSGARFPISSLDIMSNLLDSIGMKDTLSSLFAYPARTGILETLYYQPGELGLRQVAAVAEVHPRSAELALQDLLRERLVRRRRAGSRVMFALNREHLAYPLLKAVFAASEACRLRQRIAERRDAGREALSFVAGALRMMETARKSYRANH